MQLRIIFIDALSFLESGDSEHVVGLLVHGDAIIEERLPGATLEVCLARCGEFIPVGFVKELKADLFESCFLLSIDFTTLTFHVVAFIILFFLIFLLICSAVRILPLVIILIVTGSAIRRSIAHLVSKDVVCPIPL